ncbi:MAG: carboxypeptidase-like regulatory domain-containing protein [bacterium]
MPMLSTSRTICLTLVAVLTLMLLQVAPVAAASCSGPGTSSVSGKVKTPSGAPVAGVTVKLTGPNACTSQTKTNGTGGYLFLYLAKGTYTVTPSKTGCGFNPPSRVVTLGGTATANFQATCL